MITFLGIGLMNKLANYVNSELRRIAFFLQNAGVIEEHVPNVKIQKIISNLPVDWDDQFILINNKKPSETTEDDYFYGKGTRPQKLPVDLQLKGKVLDRPFTFKIEYGDNRHFYYVNFEDGEGSENNKHLLSIKAVQELFDKLSKGENPEDRDIDAIFKEMFRGKAKYNPLKDNLVKKFLSDYSQLNWQLYPSLEKNLNTIFLKLYATDATPEQYKQVFKLFTEDDPERSKFKVTDLLKNEVTNYIGSMLQDAGFDAEPRVSGVFKPQVDEEGNLSGKLGFTTTIK